MPDRRIMSLSDIFPEPSPHLDRYPMLRPPHRSRTTSRSTSSSIARSKGDNARPRDSTFDAVMRGIETRHSTSNLAESPSFGTETDRSPLDQLIQDLAIFSTTLPGRPIPQVAKPSRRTLSLGSDSEEPPKENERPPSVSVSRVQCQTPCVESTNNLAPASSSSASSANDGSGSGSGSRADGYMKSNWYSYKPQKPSPLHNVEGVFLGETDSMADGNLTSRTRHLRVYDDAAPANSQPQTPTDLHHYARNTHNRAVSDRLHSQQPIDAPIQHKAAYRRASTSQHHSHFRDRPFTTLTAEPEDAATDQRQHPWIRNISEIENETEFDAAQVEADPGIWLHRNVPSDLDTTPPHAGRFSRYL